MASGKNIRRVKKRGLRNGRRNVKRKRRVFCVRKRQVNAVKGNMDVSALNDKVGYMDVSVTSEGLSKRIT